MSRLGVHRKNGESARPLAWPGWLAEIFSAIMASSLARNAYALMSSILVTSALGMLFWLIAGRLFDQASVGIGGVLISTAVSISVATRLSLNNVLQRFLPGTGRDANRLVLGALLVGGLSGSILAFGFARIAGIFMPDLAFLAESLTFALLFSIAVTAWTIYSLLESTFSALRVAHWVPVFSISSSVLKIFALAIIATTTATGIGLVTAWIAPILPAILIGGYLVFRHLLPKLTATGRPLASIRTMARFCSFDYLASLAPTIAFGTAPLIVINYAGPETAAQYYIAWLIAYSVYLMGHSMGISLLAESVVASEKIASLAGQAIAQAALPITALSIAIAFCAPWIMPIFGPEYGGEGTLILQLLVLTCIPWVLETIFLAVARAKDWLPAILGVQWLSVTLILGFGLFLVPQMGGAGMALAWLLAQSLVLVVILIGMVMRFGPGPTINTTIVLSSGLGRILRGVFAFSAAKSSTLPAQATYEEAVNLATLHADPRLAPISNLLSGKNAPTNAWIGGDRLIRSDMWTSGFAEAATTISQLHELTASSQLATPDWLDAWIIDPIMHIRQIDRSPSKALGAVERHMLHFWANRTLDLGYSHGHLGPDHLRFSRPGSGTPDLRAIVGWSYLREDGPAGFDLCHLALITRMRMRDQELGPVVHDLLRGGALTEHEKKWTAGGGTGAEWLDNDKLRHEMVMLVWINHISRNLSLDPGYATKRTWRTINIDWPLRQATRYVVPK